MAGVSGVTFRLTVLEDVRTPIEARVSMGYYADSKSAHDFQQERCRRTPRGTEDDSEDKNARARG